MKDTFTAALLALAVVVNFGLTACTSQDQPDSISAIPTAHARPVGEPMYPPLAADADERVFHEYH